MQNLVRIGGLAAAVLAFAGSAPSAIAQNVRVLTCQDVGGGPPEPLGDREGHMIRVQQGSCRADGAYAGGVSTDQGIWEWDGPKAVELSGSGIVRKPGSTLAWKETEGTLALTITDGKVTGWTASGSRRQYVGDGRLGQIGRQGLHVDGKAHRPLGIYC